jgi:hypothetical protein
VLEFDQFIGPLGGLLCVAFGMGCIAGWGFAMKLMATRIADLKADCEKRDGEQKALIGKLQADVDKLNDFLLHGMERQLAANRDATVRVIGDLKGMTTMGGIP